MKRKNLTKLIGQNLIVLLKKLASLIFKFILSLIYSYFAVKYKANSIHSHIRLLYVYSTSFLFFFFFFPFLLLNSNKQFQTQIYIFRPRDVCYSNNSYKEKCLFPSNLINKDHMKSRFTPWLQLLQFYSRNHFKTNTVLEPDFFNFFFSLELSH